MSKSPDTPMDQTPEAKAANVRNSIRSVPVVDMGDTKANITAPQANPSKPNEGWDVIPPSAD